MTFLIAHRGLAIVARENSLDAIAAALDHVPVVEVDVRCTRDGVAVCTHDDSLQRTHGLDERIGQVDAAKLSAIAADVATLADMLDLIADRAGAVMLDVKVSRPRAIEAIEADVAASRIRWNDGAQLRAGEPIDPGTASFQSDDPHLLREVRSRTGAGCLELVHASSPSRQLLVGAPFIGAYAQGVTMPSVRATRTTLSALRALRLGTYVYTVNDQARIDELAAAGAAAIYTDRVDRMRPAA